MTPGAAAKLTVRRTGEEKSFSLTLGEVPQAREARAASPDSDSPAFGSAPGRHRPRSVTRSKHPGGAARTAKIDTTA
jgi:hypothetical protein